MVGTSDDTNIEEKLVHQLKIGKPVDLIKFPFFSKYNPDPNKYDLIFNGWQKSKALGPRIRPGGIAIWIVKEKRFKSIHKEKNIRFFSGKPSVSLQTLKNIRESAILLNQYFHEMIKHLIKCKSISPAKRTQYSIYGPHGNNFFISGVFNEMFCLHRNLQGIPCHHSEFVFSKRILTNISRYFSEYPFFMNLEFRFHKGCRFECCIFAQSKKNTLESIPKYFYDIQTLNKEKFQEIFCKIALTNKLALPPGDKMIVAPLIGQKDKQWENFISGVLIKSEKYYLKAGTY